MSLKHRENLSNSDFAVFYRTNAQSRVFEDRLRKENIPYRVVGGMKFYDRKEIKDILAYLKFIANPLDLVSLLRIINTPSRGIGQVTIDRIRETAARGSEPEWIVIREGRLGDKPPKGLNEFRNIIMKCQESARQNARNNAFGLREPGPGAIRIREEPGGRGHDREPVPA